MATNIVWQMTASKRYDFHDPELLQVQAYLDTLTKSFWQLNVGFVTAMPFLKHFPPFSGSIKEAKRQNRLLLQFLNEQLTAHRKTFDSSNIRDLIDAFLLEMEKPNHSEYFTDDQVVNILLDMFLAGTETTGKTQGWGCLFLIIHPEVILHS
jgi:cytochrome P450